jgi:hypothetical protein
MLKSALPIAFALALTACTVAVVPPARTNAYDDMRQQFVKEASAGAAWARTEVAAGRVQPFSIAHAQQQVAQTMRDPEATRFRDVRRNTETGAVCGILNAKNAYGAYVGESPFIYYTSQRNGPQVLSGSDIARVMTTPYIQAFCPDDATSLRSDAPDPADSTTRPARGRSR